MKKNKKIIILSTFVVIFICGSIVLLNNINSKSKNIEKVLSSKYYSYLTENAKDYVEQVYKETGEIPLTEKNKEDNQPYLNPDYIDYLELSDKEKEKIDLIPEPYILDYSINQSFSSSNLPSSYDLRNQNGKNYISPIKNQGSTSICWAFASIENVETLYMKNNNISYDNQIPSFSVRQMDYITSNDGYLIKKANWITCSGSCSWTSLNNSDNGSHGLNNGGNFFTSSIAMANGITLTDESTLPWHEEKKPEWAKDIYGYDKSLYEVNSTISMPTINEDSASDELINSYVSSIKTNIVKYGGPFVGTYSPKSTCGFDNVDGTKTIKTDSCVSNSANRDAGHAMQIIGWDDNYEYSYCESGTNHYSVTNGTCSNGELKTGKGAWILRNSWGTEDAEAREYSYVYLTYDSTRLSIGFSTSISDMKTRTWNNNYHSNPWIGGKISNGMSSVSEQEAEFNIHNDKSEKIEKIKFISASKSGNYRVSIISGDKEYNNIASVTTDEVGVYTLDLSSKNVVINSEKFTIRIVGEGTAKFYNNSMSIFTSNIDTNPSVTTYSSKGHDASKPLSNDNPLYVHGDNYWYLTLNTYLKNLPSSADIVYRIRKNDGVLATESAIATFDKVSISDFGEATFDGSYNTWTSTFSTREAYGQTYTFEIVYGDSIVDSFPVKFYGKDAPTTKSKVKLYANNGTENFYETTATDLQNTKFNEMSSLQTADFYNNGYYITGWNTKADGSGTNYSVTDGIPIYKDTELYAQWSNQKLKVIVSFDGQQSKTYSLDDKIVFPVNTSTKEGYVFRYWKIYSGSYASAYFEEDSTSSAVSYYVKYPVFNNTKLYVNSEWLKNDNYYTVSFDSNSGTGDMASINLTKYSYGTTLFGSNLKRNLFTKRGYLFTGWNTEPDGSGTSYDNGGVIKSEENVVLYAQWNVDAKYTITFNSNNGTGETNTQGIPELVDINLNKNTFEKEGFMFKEWNTKADGSGTSYTDEQMVSLDKNLTLYAQWIKFEYKKGDMNKSGKVELTDVIMLLKLYVNPENQVSESIMLGDMNNNSKIDLTDVIMLLKYYTNQKK